MEKIGEQKIKSEEDYSSSTVIRTDEQCEMLKASYSTHLRNRTSFDDPEYSFTTTMFSCKNNRNVEWQLTLSESTGPDSNYMSLNLYLVRSDIPELQVFFKCNLRKASEKIQSVETMFSLSLPKRNFMHMPKFVGRKALSARKLHQFEISCKIRALPKRSLDVLNKQLASDLGLLLKEEALADVTLVASNRELRAHKAILAARSPVFAKMFQHDMRERRESRVRIDDVEYEVLRAFLRFAYTAELEGNCEAMAGALIVAAEKYQFEELKRASANLLLRRMNVSNAIDTLQLAERHNFADLKLMVIEFINKHAKDIVKTPAFKALTTTQAHLIAEIYSVMAMAVSNGKERSGLGIKRINRRRSNY